MNEVTLNIVFHKLVLNEKECITEFILNIDKATEIITRIQERKYAGQTKFSKLKIYFDDGDNSFMNIFFNNIKELSLENKDIKLAIVTDQVGHKGHLSLKQLKYLKEKNINITSHGVSHAALAIYNNGEILDTPKGGVYRNMTRGRLNQLSEEEVWYQLFESRDWLEKHVGSIDEFVLPYGTYNESTVRIFNRLSKYNFLSTCDNYLDSGKNLRPRYLITNSKSCAEIIDEICLLDLN